MDVHKIETAVQVEANTSEARFAGTKEIIENYIIPAFTQYDNVAYLGMYESETTAKYVLDFGFDNLAYVLYLSVYNITVGICKKSDIDNLNVLARYSSVYTLTTGLSSVSGYWVTCNCEISIVSHNNKMVAWFGGMMPSTNYSIWFAIDVDNFNNRYFLLSGAPYYDTDDCVQGSLSVVSLTNKLDMQAYVQNPCIIKDGALKGVSTNYCNIQNSAISTSTQKQLIDIEGVRYRQMYGVHWYKESEV